MKQELIRKTREALLVRHKTEAVNSDINNVEHQARSDLLRPACHLPFYIDPLAAGGCDPGSQTESASITVLIAISSSGTSASRRVPIFQVAWERPI